MITVISVSLCFRSYLDLQVLSVVLGFMAGNWTLTPYVTCQVVGTEKLAEAHGMLMFFGGVGLMLGPPVVGQRSFTSAAQILLIFYYCEEMMEFIWHTCRHHPS